MGDVLDVRAKCQEPHWQLILSASLGSAKHYPLDIRAHVHDGLSSKDALLNSWGQNPGLVTLVSTPRDCC